MVAFLHIIPSSKNPSLRKYPFSWSSYHFIPTILLSFQFNQILYCVPCRSTYRLPISWFLPSPSRGQRWCYAILCSPTRAHRFVACVLQFWPYFWYIRHTGYWWFHYSSFYCRLRSIPCWWHHTNHYCWMLSIFQDQFSLENFNWLIKYGNHSSIVSNITKIIKPSIKRYIVTILFPFLLEWHLCLQTSILPRKVYLSSLVRNS